MKAAYFPTYTQICEALVTIFEKLPTVVFDCPFLNDAVPLEHSANFTRKELDIKTEEIVKSLLKSECGFLEIIYSWNTLHS